MGAVRGPQRARLGLLWEPLPCKAPGLLLLRTNSSSLPTPATPASPLALSSGEAEQGRYLCLDGDTVA